ncbi:hypothetical protein I5M32_08740 [Pedobacter sp. SD-b]|uniref:HTTM domain-containing protein n=1 Tax=Pedobacter segetis TaxID=2793069 RepID=A0ABS1BJH7_9SPHI|nr:hypothetical protein [Pedobacter segetis]MBK0383044.1 hypothetical protein [Pedobacter segetis]
MTETIDKNQVKTIVFCGYLILLSYKFFNGELLYQHTYPPYNYPVLNIPYWLFLLTGIKNLIFNHIFLKIVITCTLFLSSILSIIKKESTLYPKIFCFCIWIYQFSYYSIVAYQHFDIGILFPCLPFIFKDNMKFSISFNFGRYFFCGLYFLAGILKIFNGGVFNVYQMRDSILMTCLDFMYFNPNSFKTEIMSFFIQNYILGYFLYLGACILEISFILGFFGKKYDLYLFILFLVFHFSNYLLLDIPFTNHCIILTFLLPVKNYMGNKTHHLKPSLRS